MKTFSSSIIIFQILISTSAAQIGGIEQTHGSLVKSPGTIFVDDLFKQPYKQTEYPETKGSPYYSDNWKLATIELADGKIFNNVPVKLNLYTDEFICTIQEKQIVLKDKIVRRLEIQDSAENGATKSRIFTGYFSTAESSHPVLEVLCAGKATLLLYSKKRILDNKSPYGGEKEFSTYETTYIFFNNTISKCEKDADFYLNLFAEKRQMLDAFISANKLKCRSTSDIKKLIDYYNSL